jgi:putative ABC transport system permease protein
MAVHGEMLGQLSLNKPGLSTRGKLEPRRYLIPEAELGKIQAVVRREFPQATVIPRLSLDGLVSNGTSSTIFVAFAIDPRDLHLLLGPLGGAYRSLAPEKPSGVSMADGLASMLGLKIGDPATLLVSTIDGQANAADAEVIDRVNTGNVATNDKAMLIPLELARSLKNVGQAAEWVTILLDKVTPARSRDEGIRSLFATESRTEQEVEAAQARLKAALAAEGIELDVSSWRDLSAYYSQVKRLYDIIFTLLLSIVVAIVALSIANAMSMSVVERTREIGTMRAMGLRRFGVIRLFATEALLLVLVGSALGVVLAAIAGSLITAADIRYVPPGNSIAVPVYISFDAARIGLTVLSLGAMSLVASFLPARKAARQPIIDSLSHA